MSKANWVYIAFIATLVGGIWAIVTLGRTLRAPTDLAGTWDIDWDWRLIPPNAGRLPTQLHIDQSGLFITATTDRQTRLTGRMQPATRPGAYALTLLRATPDDQTQRVSAPIAFLDIPHDGRPTRLTITLQTNPPRTGTARRQANGPATAPAPH
jgi:hypothetical protein